MTVEEIKRGTAESPIIFRTDEETEAYLSGLKDGVNISEEEIIDKACKTFEEYLMNTFQFQSTTYNNSIPIDVIEMRRVQHIKCLVNRFRQTVKF